MPSTQPSKMCGALVDVLGIGAVGRVQFRGDGELAAAQHALEPPARGVAGQRRKRGVRLGADVVGMGGHARAVLNASQLASRVLALLAHDPQPGRRALEAVVDRRLDLGDPSPSAIWRLPSQAFTQTQGISGRPRNCRPAGTPPQGPLRRPFGQFIGQDMPVEDRMHWPHMRQSNSAPLIAFSTNATGRSAGS